MGSQLKSRNNSIDIFRLVCSLMVVAIHTHPFSEVNEFMGFIFTDALTRIAVPFFLVVSGYFYFDKLVKMQNIMIKYVKKIAVIYTIWSIPYFLINVWVWHDEFSLIEIIKRLVIDYLFLGTSFQFWYFPALIYSVIIFTFIYKLFKGKMLPILIISIILFVLGCLFTSYTGLVTNVPFLSEIIKTDCFTTIRRIFLTGLPFFALGCLINNYWLKFAGFSNKIMCALLFISSILYFFEKTLLYLFYKKTDPMSIYIYIYRGYYHFSVKKSNAEIYCVSGKMQNLC